MDGRPNPGLDRNKIRGCKAAGTFGRFTCLVRNFTILTMHFWNWDLLQLGPTEKPATTALLVQLYRYCYGGKSVLQKFEQPISLRTHACNESATFYSRRAFAEGVYFKLTLFHVQRVSHSIRLSY